MTAGRRSRKTNAKGRNVGSASFVMFDVAMLESAAYASLTLAGRALLQELRMLFKGNNNGSIYLSVRDAVARLGLSDDKAVTDAFDQLQEAGFIDLAKDAHFEVKASTASRARCWRLTWESWPECPTRTKRAPTNRWRDFVPVGGTKEARRADRRLRALSKYRKAKAQNKLPVVKSRTLEADMGQDAVKPVVKSTPAKSEKDAFQPKLIVRDSTAHIDSTRGSRCSRWWESDAEAKIRAKHILLVWMTQNGPQLARAA